MFCLLQGVIQNRVAWTGMSGASNDVHIVPADSLQRCLDNGMLRSHLSKGIRAGGIGRPSPGQLPMLVTSGNYSSYRRECTWWFLGRLDLHISSIFAPSAPLVPVVLRHFSKEAVSVMLPSWKTQARTSQWPDVSNCIALDLLFDLSVNKKLLPKDLLSTQYSISQTIRFHKAVWL